MSARIVSATSKSTDRGTAVNERDIPILEAIHSEDDPREAAGRALKAACVARRLASRGALPDRQLQTPQPPTAQRHAGGSAPAPRGPQRRTHSSAAASVRSLVPPGQQRASIAATSRSVSDSARVDTDSICATMLGSPGEGSMTPASTGRRPGLSHEPTAPCHLDKAPMRPDQALRGLRNPRDAFLVQRHLPCDSVVGEAFDQAQAVHDQARVCEGTSKLLALAGS
jgi:hypothetical protein